MRCRWIVLVALGAGFVTGCATPPDKELARARTSFEAAVAAGADTFASAPMARARQAHDALDAEVARQSRAWVKSFTRVEDLAMTVQAESQLAVSGVSEGRARLVSAATAGTDVLLGPNLFENGDFAKGAAGWDVHPQSDATVSVEGRDTPAPVWHVTYRKGNWSVIYQEHPLKPDTVYVYEAWVKTTAPIVALYWQSDIGRFLEMEKVFPQWTRARYVFVTPHWDGKPYRVGFNPVLMKGAGEAWLRDLRIAEVMPR